MIIILAAPRANYVLVFLGGKCRVRYWWLRVPYLNQLETVMLCFLALDWLKYRTLPNQSRTVLIFKSQLFDFNFKNFIISKHFAPATILSSPLSGCWIYFCYY